MTKVRTRFNALLTFLLSLLGLGTFSCGMYGVPHGKYDIQGQVTDTENKPLKDMQVIVKNTNNNNFQLPDDTVYTSTDGKFHSSYWGEFFDKSAFCIVVVNDTNGIYQSITQTSNYVYYDDNKPFSWGTGYAYFEIEMNKK